MGAHSEIVTFDGKLTPKELEKAWAQKVRDCLFEQGHDAYNGTISTMGGGVRVFADKVFDSVEAAEEWVLDTHRKWDDGIAVRAKNVKKSRPKWTFGGKEEWADNPWTYRYGHGLTGEKMLVLADQLTATEKKQVEKAVAEFDKRDKAYREPSYALGKLQFPFSDLRAEIPSTWLRELKKVRKQIIKTQAALDKAQTALTELAARLKDKHCAMKSEDKGLIWVAGGWAAE